jgi:probable HAF family extracellular repeat protein
MLDRRSISALLLVALLLALPAQAQGTPYTITNISQAAPGSPVGIAGLSDSGYACGWTVPSASSGFRWSAGETFFPPPPAGIVWKSFNAVNVNDRGAVVGWFNDLSPNLLTRGYCTQAGASTELLTPLGHRAFPMAINDRGWIVGYAGIQPPGTPGAVLWSPDFVASFVGTLDRAVDINDAGQIVGFAKAASGVTQAFLASGPRLIPLGSLDPSGKGDVLPSAINAAGVVVGISMIGSKEHAFRWSEQEGMTELPGLGSNLFPFNVAALDVNEHGEAVGYAPGPNGQTGVLWSKDGSVHALEPLVPDIGPDKDWPSLLHVMRINSAGQIVAMAPHKPSSFQARFVLLTPAKLQATLRETTAADGAAVNVLDVDGANPFEPVYLAASPEDPLDVGYTIVPGCAPLGLSMATPRVLAKLIADGAGHAAIGWSLPPALAGQALRLQVFQPTARKLSNVVHLSR